MYPTINRQETGRRLRFFMSKKGITARKIQEYLNLTCVQSVYHWLDGRSLPTVDNLYALSDLFGVSIEYLICGDRSLETYLHVDKEMLRVLEYCQELTAIMAA